MPNKPCPQCHEENPQEAVMCWACYTPLGESKATPIELPDGSKVNFPYISWWQRNAREIMPVLIIITLISSGWWRGKTRFGIVGFGLSLIAATFAIVKYEERQEKQQQTDSVSAIRRIVDTIMLYAVKDGASQIRIIKYEKGVSVEYKIDKEWHDQMRIPTYTWQALLNKLVTRAGSGNIEFENEGEKAQFKLYIVIEPPHQAVTLTKVTAA